jgi:glucose/arabinose dehydrogenase
VKPQRPDLVAQAIKPDYALGPHTGSLGLACAENAALGSRFDNGMFVGQHGSWNRKPRSGYKVIFVPFSNGKPSGQPIDVLTGFVTESGDAMGRPVGVAIDRRGALLVADDGQHSVACHRHKHDHLTVIDTGTKRIMADGDVTHLP